MVCGCFEGSSKLIWGLKVRQQTTNDKLQTTNEQAAATKNDKLQTTN
jgi:hypothetical protein